MAKDIVDVAIAEIGYSETGNNSTKYGKWYGMNGAAWCHMFVSWCANQAGVNFIGVTYGFGFKPDEKYEFISIDYPKQLLAILK